MWRQMGIANSFTMEATFCGANFGDMWVEMLWLLLVKSNWENVWDCKIRSWHSIHVINWENVSTSYPAEHNLNEAMQVPLAPNISSIKCTLSAFRNLLHFFFFFTKCRLFISVGRLSVYLSSVISAKIRERAKYARRARFRGHATFCVPRMLRVLWVSRDARSLVFRRS